MKYTIQAGDSGIIGTEKQIKWALDIKNAPIKACEDEISADHRKELFTGMLKGYKMIINAMEKKDGAEKASFWIENRCYIPNFNRIYQRMVSGEANGRELQENVSFAFSIPVRYVKNNWEKF